MIRTTIIAGGLLGLGIFTAAPAMAAPPPMMGECSPPAQCSLVDYYTGTGPGTAANLFTTAWLTAPKTVGKAWATGPQTAINVWKTGLGL
jgi:hypothetical protein